MASKIALGVVFLFGVLIPNAVAQAPAGMPLVGLKLPAIESKEEIGAYVLQKDIEGGFNGQFYQTMRCESAGWQNIQSMVIQKDGMREDSWGVVQIHIPSHPHITKEMALDVRWAVDWAAQEFKRGNEWKWTCYRNLQNGVSP